MAWIRTSLSILAVSGAAARLALIDGLDWGAGLGVFAGFAGLTSLVLWWQRIRHAHGVGGMSSGRSLAAPGAVLSSVVAVCCTGLVGLALGLHDLLR